MVKQIEHDVIDAQYTQEPSKAELDLEQALDEVFSSLGEEKEKVEVQIKCYRAPQGEAKRIWLFDLSEGEFGEVTKVLRDSYGTGSYEIRVMVAGRIYRRIMTYVEAPSDLAKLHSSQIPTPSGTQDMLAIMREMMQQQQESQRQQTELLLERVRSVQNTPQQSIDPVAMMTAMVTAMGSIHQMLPQPKDTDTFGNFDRMLDMQIKLKQLTGEGGDTNSPLSWLALGRDYLGAMKELGKGAANNQPQQRQLPMPVPPQSPRRRRYNPPEVDINKPVNQESENDMNLKRIGISQALSVLCAKAAQGRNPLAYAEVTLDTAEDYSMFDELMELLEADDWLEKLEELNPDVKAFETWFIELRDEILVLTSEDGSANDDQRQESDTSKNTIVDVPQAAPEAKNYPIVGKANDNDVITGRQGGNASYAKDNAQSGKKVQKRS